jgi:hypothetical protein
MKDIVTYAPPYGLLGVIANALVIRNKLKKYSTIEKRRLRSDMERINDLLYTDNIFKSHFIIPRL